MISGNYLRTIDLAREAGLSVQQVRNYEARGFLPPASRSKSSYRQYTNQHLSALKATRRLIVGYGWQGTQNIMRAVHQGDLVTALSLIDARHAEFANKRLQIKQTLEALRILSKQSPSWSGTLPAQKLQIGEAARLVGVRTSAIHFWEQQGLLHPVRDKSSRYRLYDERQMRNLRVVVLLREAGYGFEAIHSVLEEIAQGRPEKAIQAVEKRGEELAKISWACIEAMASFKEYISAYYPQMTTPLTTAPPHWIP